ncbi:neprilysin-1 [Drosophila pseudoobscura]|uniref:Neprilysin-1 n=1 Tax=Drosophila pseudoobscura pseudoobscura TaxID=46245 RepID=A0A6I8WDV7_DROPS|nr:neprilysin-1 [Drosophila pseudoobscura]
MGAIPQALFCLIFIALGRLDVQGGVYKELTTPLGHEIMRHAKSADMRSFIDPSVSPCDDFYGYACGKYPSINAASRETDKSIGQALRAGYLRRVRQLLNEPKMSTDRPMETRVKYFYESCLNTTALRMNQRSHLLHILREFGGMPAVEGSTWDESKFDAIDMMATLLRRYGKITFIGVSVGPDIANSQINRLSLGQRDDLVVIKDEESMKLVKKVRLKWRLQQLLGVSPERAQKTAIEIGTLDSELGRSGIDRKMVGDPRLRQRLTVISSLTETYGPSLNFTRFVSTWLDHDYQLPVYEYVPGYLWQLNKILSSTPKRVLANYMLSSLVEDFVVELESEKQQQQQEDYCAVRTTDLFPAVVDHMVYHSLEQQSPHIPVILRQLFQELKDTFEAMLNGPDLEWLDEQTRNGMVEKLKLMSFQISGEESVDFEEHYGSLIISSADYYGNIERLLEVRALNLREDLQRPQSKPIFYDDTIDSPCYVREANMVVFPASHMQHRYFWDDVYPAALKYGTLGFDLAHEIAHAFDDSNLLFDGKGNLRDSWSSDAKTSFKLLKQCLVDQFSELRFGNQKLPRRETQGENIADNVGIRIALAAYQKWLLDHSKTVDAGTEALPHMPQTPLQVFFLSLTQTMCSDVLPERRHAHVMTSVHAPSEARVRAMMGNTRSFAEAFQCGNTTRMNPPLRCKVY